MAANDSSSGGAAENSQAILKKEYQDILKKNGITSEISEVVVTIPELKGQHFGSLIELAEIKFENGEPSTHFFVKKLLPIPPSQAPLLEMMKQMTKSEGRFLTEFTEDMKKVCKDKGAENGLESMLDNLFPKTFHCDEGKIVIENLVKRDFDVIPKKDKLGFNHAALVLKNLAKFHAVTFVMIQDAGGAQEFLKTYPDQTEKMVLKEIQDFFSSVFEPGLALNLQLLSSCSHPEKDEKCAMLKEYQGKIGKAFGDICGAPSLVDVTCHGDLWSNNIMFEGKGPEHTNLKFVDLQMIRLGSPNLDVGYFLFTSVRPADRKRTRELLQLYFDELKQTVQSLGHSFDHSFEEFLEDFKIKSKIGFFSGFFQLVGFEAMAEHDTEKDTGDIPFEQMFIQMLTKFIAENPDRVEEIGSSIVTMINDYLEFGEL